VTTAVPRIEYSRLQLGKELGRGGQGRVIAVEGILIDHRWDAALKRYSPDVAPSIDVAALEAITIFPGTLGADDKLWLYENTAWPAVIVEGSGRVCGFLMRTVPLEYYFGFRTQTQGIMRRLTTMEFLLNDDQYTSKAGLTVTDLQRVALLQNLAVILSRLHALGAVVGDLSPKNLLFQLTPSPSCFLIDCDAMRVQGASVLRQVETPDWEVPAGEQTATPEADAYKFALLAIRLFARDQSSRNPEALAQLSPELGDLAADSLDLEASRRPSIADWKPTLAKAYNTLDHKRVPPRPPGAPLRRRLALVKMWAIFAILAAAILVIILVGLNIGSHPVSASPPTTSPPAASSPQTGARTSTDATSAQATQINYLLTASAAARNLLATALHDARHCNDIAGAAATIKAVAQRYGTEYSMAAHLETGQLPNGVALKNDLIDAYYRSATADYYFAEWAQYLKVSGCTSSTSAAAAYNAGVENTVKATRAKDAFAELWNPVAKSESLAPRSGDGI
jgi:hypothetical protein